MAVSREKLPAPSLQRPASKAVTAGSGPLGRLLGKRLALYRELLHHDPAILIEVTKVRLEGADQQVGAASGEGGGWNQRRRPGRVLRPHEEPIKGGAVNIEVAHSKHARVGLQRVHVGADLVDGNAVIATASLEEDTFAQVYDDPRRVNVIEGGGRTVVLGIEAGTWTRRNVWVIGTVWPNGRRSVAQRRSPEQDGILCTAWLPSSGDGYLPKASRRSRTEHERK